MTNQQRTVSDGTSTSTNEPTIKSEPCCFPSSSQPTLKKENPPPTSQRQRNNKTKHTKTISKPKMTTEERRIKYTLKAREKRQQERLSLKQRHLVCFHCRKKGHVLSQCPLFSPNSNSTTSTTITTTTTTDTKERQENNKKIEIKHSFSGKHDSRRNICYKCGSDAHALKDCPHLQPEDFRIDTQHDRQKKNKMAPLDYSRITLPFAHCFLCQLQGHLASQCPDNKKGIYVHGGQCRECGSTDHLLVHCPVSKEKKKNNTTIPTIHDTSLDGEQTQNHQIIKETPTMDDLDSLSSSSSHSMNEKRSNPIRKKRMVHF